MSKEKYNFSLYYCLVLIVLVFLVQSKAYSQTMTPTPTPTATMTPTPTATMTPTPTVTMTPMTTSPTPTLAPAACKLLAVCTDGAYFLSSASQTNCASGPTEKDISFCKDVCLERGELSSCTVLCKTDADCGDVTCLHCVDESGEKNVGGLGWCIAKKLTTCSEVAACRKTTCSDAYSCLTCDDLKDPKPCIVIGSGFDQKFCCCDQ